MYVYVCSVVANYDKATAEFLLPYLVWSVMTLGTDENKKKVMELLTATLKESQDKTKYSEGPQCVQFVYNIIDSLNKLVSENAKVKDKRAPSSTYRSGRGGGGSSTSTSSSGTGSGSGDQLFLGFDTSPQFLSEFNKMLDDVAFDVFKAAIASKSYPRALLYFEKYAKITQVTSTTLRGYYEQLQEAYLNLNDVDSLAYISSIAKDASSKDYIRYLEYSGKWHEALICYDTAFSLSSSSSAMPFSSTTSSSSSSSSFQPRPPLDPSLILGRLECLKEVGHFDTMLSLVQSHLSTHYYIPQLQLQLLQQQQQQQQLLQQQRQKSQVSQSSLRQQQQQQQQQQQSSALPVPSPSPFGASSLLSSFPQESLITGSLSAQSPSSLSSSSLASAATLGGDPALLVSAQIPPPPQVGSSSLASFISSLVGYGVQASWRLGQWEQLNCYINDPMCPKQSQSWEVAVGSGVLALFERNREYLSAVIDNARAVITKSITAASLDSYQRCYPDMVKLHILHEMEQIGELLPAMPQAGCSATAAAGASGVTGNNDAAIMECLAAMEKSLDITQPSLKAREPILNVTKLLYKIFQNKNEGKIWLKVAKLARKSGNVQTAYSAIQKAK